MAGMGVWEVRKGVLSWLRGTGAVVGVVLGVCFRCFGAGIVWVTRGGLGGSGRSFDAVLWE